MVLAYRVTRHPLALPMFVVCVYVVTEDEGWYDCAVCSDLTTAEKEALASYDNGGKKIVCDPTCLDGVSDPTHCNC